MKNVHWSVWGLVGFIGTLTLGLWIDSRWLLGVGAQVPPTQSSPAISPAWQYVTTADEEESAEEEVPHQTHATDGCKCATVDLEIGGPSPVIAGDSHDLDVTVGLSVPGVISPGLDIPFVPVDEPEAEPELLPEPQISGPTPVDEPLDTSGFGCIGRMAPCDILKLPAEEHKAPSEENAGLGEWEIELSLDWDSSPSEPPVVAKDESKETADDLLEIVGSRVLHSPILAPDAKSRADFRQHFYDAFRREEEADREAALLNGPPPVRPPGTAPPLPQAAVQVAPLEAGHSVEHIESLRGAAEQLDQISHQLERQGLYDRADRLRGMAQEMRVDARRMIGPPTAVMPPLPRY